MAQDKDHQGPLTRASKLLRKKELTADEANELTEIISEMASSNIIAQFEAKLDAQTSKINVLIWVIGFATVILSAVITLNSIFS
ncbi:MAG: hypothetical protein OXD43_05240 [Bacteroidetes bacterium]|nr:hypothetical protein [Bacteroidota bacterium]